MMVLGVVVDALNGANMGPKPHKKPYFLGVLAAFLAARSALAEQFLEQTVIGVLCHR